MEEATDAVPKPFLEVGGETLYERQRTLLDGRVDGVTVVLGYGYESVKNRVDFADAVVLDCWDEYDNAESLRRGLECVDDDAFVLNGDVLVAPSVLDRLRRRYNALDGAYNVVGCLPGVQNEHTAIQCDEADAVVEYGMIPGYRHAGVGIIGNRHREEALDVLERNREEWYPLLYPKTPTKRVIVPPDDHLEINRPTDLEAARERLPLEP